MQDKEQGRTITALPGNIAPKAVLAFVYPVIAAAVTSAIAWALGGEVFDVEPIKIAAGGVAAGGLAALGAYLGKPGTVVYPAHERYEIHDAPGA